MYPRSNLSIPKNTEPVCLFKMTNWITSSIGHRTANIVLGRPTRTPKSIKSNLDQAMVLLIIANHLALRASSILAITGLCDLWGCAFTFSPSNSNMECYPFPPSNNVMLVFIHTSCSGYEQTEDTASTTSILELLSDLVTSSPYTLKNSIFDSIISNQPRTSSKM